MQKSKFIQMTFLDKMVLNSPFTKDASLFIFKQQLESNFGKHIRMKLNSEKYFLKVKKIYLTFYTKMVNLEKFKVVKTFLKGI